MVIAKPAMVQIELDVCKCNGNINGVLSNEFPVNNVVLQGNVLSPMLFILLMDFVMYRAVGNGREALDWIGNKKLEDLQYADDTVISKTPQVLQSLLTGMHDISDEVGLKINRRQDDVNGIRDRRLGIIKGRKHQ
ncbi:uncharacterized protein [Palaemon carinicauda]|uniref:uncharacterized protein n=1 Tax=Palaemon carinicauda TaxID=392227 RepID=UPI0035B67092